jgi:uncharacterized membrane protein/Mg-chelatase subunit ChlD
VTFSEPLWLLLALPLVAALWLWPAISRTLTVLRVIVLLLVLLALAGLALQLPGRAGVVVVVADRSRSMPVGAAANERELVRAVDAKRSGESRTGVVSFGRTAEIELLPEGATFGEFRMREAEDGSNLHDAIQTALSMVPRDVPGRIVVLSDGRWTGRDPSAAALRAAANGVAIDYRVITRSSAADVAVERIDAPTMVAPRESFVIAATIDAPREMNVTVELRRGNTVIAAGEHHLVAGSNRIAFRDRAPRGGTSAYMISVGTAADDPIPENNRARFLVGVDGPKPVLVASGSRASRLTSLLTASGVDAVAAERPDWSLDALSNYSAVVLENIPSQDIGVSGMQTLASWVTHGGGALMLTGGQGSYGAGGYFKSPLDPLLPVSMELRREHRKVNVSIVIALDRSGSMGMEASGGRTKMELANLSAVQVLDLLSPRDELGVVAVDSSAHIIADLDPIEGRKDLRHRITSVQSAGGGIFIFEALSTAAKMLLTAGSATRHIILFADAADSEEPGAYRELLAKCAKENITVTVIGLGKDTDSDADLLRDIAARGSGRIFFTDDANELPRLFAQDTFIVARSAFVDEATAQRTSGSLFTLTGRQFSGMPAIGGYNLTYLRNGASAAVLTEDEHHAPVVAAWQAGNGRVVAYTGEIDGRFTGALAKWPQIGDYYTSLVRWVAGARPQLPGDMLVTQQVVNGVNNITLQLDPERPSTRVTRTPRVTTLAGQPPSVTQADMTWRTPDELGIEVPLDGAATFLSTVDVPGVGRVTLPPVALPYSPELAPAAAGEGRAALERIARATGGKERIEVAGVWRDLAVRRHSIPLRMFLLLAAVLVLLLEVLERRMRIFAFSSEVVERGASGPRQKNRRAKARRSTVVVEEPPVPPPPEPAVESPLVDALQQAGKRARRRT